MKQAAGLAAGWAIGASRSPGGQANPADGAGAASKALPVPLPRQKVWQDCEVGAIFHFDMPLFGGAPWSGRTAIHTTYDPKKYNPARLDTDQWVSAAKAMGARYAIVTATHFNGFLQWQSALYPYGVKQAAWRGGKGDLVKDFVASCRKAKILPGVYLSCFRNAWWKVDRYRVNYGKGGPGQARFARTCEKMVEELCSRYGPLMQIWFDAGLISPKDGGPDVLPIVDKHQPNMVFYHSPQRREHRWIGNEAGFAGYPCWATMPDLPRAEAAHKGRKKGWRKLLEHGDPDGVLWSPGMVDTVLRNHHWFWKPNTERTVASLDRLVSFYYRSVGRNCNLILGLTPDPTGLVPEPDVKRLGEFGREIARRFGKPLATTAGRGPAIELALPQGGTVDHVHLMERIERGERIREYVVEGRRADGAWQKLCAGTSVGHKRIETFPAAEVDRLRLRVTASRAVPLIREFAAFAVGQNGRRLAP